MTAYTCLQVLLLTICCGDQQASQDSERSLELPAASEHSNRRMHNAPFVYHPLFLKWQMRATSTCTKDNGKAQTRQKAGPHCCLQFTFIAEGIRPHHPAGAAWRAHYKKTSSRTPRKFGHTAQKETVQARPKDRFHKESSFMEEL